MSFFQQEVVFSILSYNWTSSYNQKWDLFFLPIKNNCGSLINSQNDVVYALDAVKQHNMHNIHTGWHQLFVETWAE